LGSNLGDNQKNIDVAIKFIKSIKQINYIRKAKYYITKAWGKTNQADFLNTVIEIETTFTAEQMLFQLQEIESQMGRIRKEKWGERIIDIDILTYGDENIQQQNLIIPHPYIIERSFVLAPLYELNPELALPKLGKIKNFINHDEIAKEIVSVY
jgi:2-amino-4-hydroxy-6-hydroxymethyldihydropteridine diphosphokinase